MRPIMCINTSKYGQFWSWSWVFDVEGSEIGIYSDPWRVGEKDRDERQLILWNMARKQQEGDDISAQYEKTLKNRGDPYS